MLCRRLPGCLLMLFLAVTVPGPVLAQASNDAFTVKGVDVDVTAGNSNSAKEQALAEGQRAAFQQLLERLTPASDRARLPKADGVNYVRDFAIDAERSSTVRYIATLTVRFNPTSVKRLLHDAGLSFTDVRSRAVVVVPVLTAQGRTMLWDEPNPWRAAWASISGGLVPLQVPAGEVGDLQALTAEQALAGDPQRLAALGARWHSPDVMVAVGTLSNEGRRLDVRLSGLPGTPIPFDVVGYDQRPGEGSEQFLGRAVRDIARAIDAGYKQANVLQFDRSATLSAIVPLAGLDDWMAVRERLGRVPQVRSYEVVSLSRVEAALMLHIVGEQDRVRSSLASAGLALEWADGYWTMRTAARR